jgi:hypothetical protein
MPCKYLKNVVPAKGTGECALVDDLAPGEDPFVKIRNDDCECRMDCYARRTG